MSKYEWERGTIKIPAKEYSKLRKAVITEYNRLQDELYNEAVQAHAKILAAKKGKRGFDVYKYAAGYDGLDLSCDLLSLLFNREKLRKPKKSGLRKKPVSKDCTLDIGEADITFNGRCVIWDVPENNHACESARQHSLAKFLFRKLSNIAWTRGSGGQIIGNDEYNRDSDYKGGGSNYVTASYPSANKSYGSYGQRLDQKGHN